MRATLISLKPLKRPQRNSLMSCILQNSFLDNVKEKVDELDPDNPDLRYKQVMEFNRDHLRSLNIGESKRMEMENRLIADTVKQGDYPSHNSRQGYIKS
jgi:hypothetical protein